MLLARQKGADKGAGELVASRGSRGAKLQAKGSGRASKRFSHQRRAGELVEA